MPRSLLASASALALVGTLGVGDVFAFGIPGGGKLPGLGGGGGGTNSITDVAKKRAAKKILKRCLTTCFTALLPLSGDKHFKIGAASLSMALHAKSIGSGFLTAAKKTRAFNGVSKSRNTRKFLVP